MSLPLVFHPAVRGEIEEAVRWYRRQRAGLEEEYMSAIEDMTGRMTSHPEAHAPIHGNIRRALARRFPYAIFYRIHKDRIEVLAIQHTSRDPRHWKSRA